MYIVTCVNTAKMLGFQERRWGEEKYMASPGCPRIALSQGAIPGLKVELHIQSVGTLGLSSLKALGGGVGDKK